MDITIIITMHFKPTGVCGLNGCLNTIANSVPYTSVLRQNEN